MAVEGYDAYAKACGGTGYRLLLKISGVHCASCMQKIESALHEATTKARLNFTTGALTIEWNGTPSKANDFVGMIEGLGYGVTPFDGADEHQQKENRFLLLCMGVAGFAAGNIMLLSFGLWMTNAQTMGAATRDFLHLISALIAIPAVIFAGRPFFRSAWAALTHRRTNMDVPIALALILATGMSVHELWRGAEHVYFDSAVMLCFFLLIGRYLDFRARASARSAATDLMQGLHGFATVIENNKMRKIPIRDVKPDMVVSVAVGESFPVDGQITKGKTEIDTSLVTGETVPLAAEAGSHIYAGTVNLSAPVEVQVSKPASDSLLSDIVRLMERAEQGRARYTRIADRLARYYTPVVHCLAAAAFVMWFFGVDLAWQDALMIAVTVLIITCPCALALAVPVAQVIATGEMMKQGILVKSGDALERLAAVTHVFMDKTGTLTRGTPHVMGDYRQEDLQLAASIAYHSHHPLSQALVQAYDGDLLTIESVQEIPGCGLQGVYDGEVIKLGSRGWCGDMAATPTSHSEIWLTINDVVKGCFLLSDPLRPDVESTLEVFRRRGLDLSLLSGDRESVVTDIANQVGLHHYTANMKPTDKFHKIEAAQDNNATVLMIGDGLNDAPVLTKADIAITPGSAIDMAQNTADIVFMGDSFDAVGRVYKMALRTQYIIRQNFAIALLYNMVAIPIAFMGWVTPMVAAIAMSGSSLLVILNSFRLRWRQS